MIGVDEYLGVLAADAEDVVTLVRERAQLAVGRVDRDDDKSAGRAGRTGLSGRSAAGS